MTEPKHTAQGPKAAAPGGVGLKLSDVYYVIFRRKWLILTFLLAGIGGSLAYYLLQKPREDQQAQVATL